MYVRMLKRFLHWVVAATAHAQTASTSSGLATSTSSGQATSTSSGQGYPQKPIRRILPVPPGHPNNPLTDEDIERKFFELFDGVLTAAQAQRVTDGVGKFERCADIGELLSHMTAV